MAAIQDLINLLARTCQESPAAEYVHKCARGFLSAYGRGHYEDAATWSRRMAESFCIFILTTVSRKEDYGIGLLGDMMYDLPWSVSNYRAFDHAYGVHEVESISAHLGVGLSRYKIWDDLRYMQWYGNQGAHAANFFRYGPLDADADLFVSAIRIVVTFVALHRRVYSGLHPKSKL